MGVTPTILGENQLLSSTTGAVAFQMSSVNYFRKVGTPDAGATYLELVVKGDIFELKMDRSSGAFSSRVFRNEHWIDLDVVGTVNSLTFGNLYFSVDAYY